MWRASLSRVKRTTATLLCDGHGGLRPRAISYAPLAARLRLAGAPPGAADVVLLSVHAAPVAAGGDTRRRDLDLEALRGLVFPPVGGGRCALETTTPKPLWGPAVGARDFCARPPLLIAGDFNAHAGELRAAFGGQLHPLLSESFMTNAHGNKAYDNVLHEAGWGRAMKVLGCAVCESEDGVSDHTPVTVRLKLLAPAAP